MGVDLSHIFIMNLEIGQVGYQLTAMTVFMPDTSILWEDEDLRMEMNPVFQ